MHQMAWIRLFALIFCIHVLYYSQLNGVSGKCAGKKSKVTFVTRADWGAEAPKERKNMVLPVGYAVAHHTATKQCSTQEECSTLMRSVQNDHMNVKGWDDIGYNFLIGGDKKVYIGRGWNTVGAHAGPQYNSRSIGTAIIGNYTDELPSTDVLQVLKDLHESGVKSGYLTPTYILCGHRDVRATECPGEKLYKEIQKWPHYPMPNTTVTPHPDL